MSVQNSSLTILKDVRDILAQIEKHGTPLRIDGTTETYYVLSADQLITLFRVTPQDEESVSPLTPEDFGLTEAVLAAYEARRTARREQVDLNALAPLDTDVEQRLLHVSQIQRHRPLSEKEVREREQLVHELEAAMFHNLRAVAEKAN